MSFCPFNENGFRKSFDAMYRIVLHMSSRVALTSSLEGTV